MIRQEEFSEIQLSVYQEPFVKGLESFCLKLLSSLSAMESGFRQFYPPQLENLYLALVPYQEKLNTATIQFNQLSIPSELKVCADILTTSSEFALQSFSLLKPESSAEKSVYNVMKGMLTFHQAVELLFPLRKSFRPINRYFLEPLVRGRDREFISLASNSDVDGFFIHT